MTFLLYNNYSCSEKETFKSYQKLFEKLLTVKSKLNNKASETPIFLKCKASLKEHKKDEERKITKINNLLNTKIQSVMNSPSKYSQRLSSPKYCPAFDKQRFNYSRIELEKKIKSENSSLLIRFTKRKPTYSTKNLLKKYNYEQYIKKNISKSKFLPKVSLKLRTFGDFKSNFIKDSAILFNKFDDINNTTLSEINNNNSFKNNLVIEKNNKTNFSFNENNNSCLSTKESLNRIQKHFVKNIRLKIDNKNHINQKKFE